MNSELVATASISAVVAWGAGLCLYAVVFALGASEYRGSDTVLKCKAVVGAVMRKMAHLIYGVIKSGKPFDANFSHNELAFQDGI